MREELCTGLNVNSNYCDDNTINYFGKDYWDLVNSSCASFDETIKQIYFLNELFKENTVKRVLDIMCGNCRHILALNRLGYTVSGLDINRNVLEKIKGNRNYREEIELVCADIREYDISQIFDSVILLQSCMGYFSEDEDIKLLSKVFKSLNKKGILVLDIPNKSNLLGYYCARDWKKVGDSYYLIYNTYDHIKNIKYVNTKILVANKVKNYYMKMKIYSVSEMFNILKSIGFEKIQVYGDFKNEIEVTKKCSDSSIEEGYRRIQIVAKKVL